MRALTVPQQRILDAIRTAAEPVGRHQIGVASKSYTITVVRWFLQQRLIHIADWRRTGNSTWPRYRYGPGVDAPRPRASREELLRRKRDRQRRQMAAERAMRAAERALRAPPALPTHTPTFGIWGI